MPGRQLLLPFFMACQLAAACSSAEQVESPAPPFGDGPAPPETPSTPGGGGATPAPPPEAGPTCANDKARCGANCCSRVTVAAGNDFACALTASGGVRCWGGNATGQLGNGTSAPSSAPVDVLGLESGVVALAAGGSHACALTTAGGVQCWGANHAGQLGDGTTAARYTPVDVPSLPADVVAIAAGVSTTCVITTAGGLRCWGQMLAQPAGTSAFLPLELVPSSVVSVAIGAGHACYRTSNGEARCLGGNPEGQLGNGTVSPSMAPVVPVTQGVTDVAASPRRSASVANGAMTWWGAGVGATPQPGPTDVRAVRLSYADQPSVLHAGGTVSTAWGGDGFKPVSGLADAVELVVGGGHACARTAGGDVLCWGGANPYAAVRVPGL